MKTNITRQAFLKSLGGAAALLAAQTVPALPKKRYNVLFIPVDDLRPELGCYGAEHVVSPNIDRIAAQGTAFLRAYCQQAVCSPSRTSLMTGARPDTTQVYDLETHFRDKIPNVVTLSQHFKMNGYHTQSMGKIYHGSLDDKPSWTVKGQGYSPVPQPRLPRVGAYMSPEGMAIMKAEQKRAAEQQKAQIKKQGKPLTSRQKKALRARGPAWEVQDVPDDQTIEGALALNAISVLRQRAKQPNKPWFVAVGFHKPHLPFTAPKKYWDLYKRDEIELADNPYPPKDAPKHSMTNWGELRNYYGMPAKGPLDDDTSRTLKHGYLACVSFIDEQIRRMLDELKTLGMADNTVVCLWGDHGWKLGEHGGWCKHTNFENDANAPLIISVPGQKTAGQPTKALVDFVDIYPSLCEICGLELPSHLEGTSFVPVMDKLDRPWKKAAISQYPRGKVMGYALKTDRYRFVEWLPRGTNPEGAKVEGEVELYDHKHDPAENVNVAKRPENAKVVADMRKLLRGGWRAALPPVSGE